MARAQAQVGETAAALDLIEKALERARTGSELWVEPELLRIKGELALAEGARDTGEAELCFRRALDTAQARAARAWELRAGTSLARLWAEEGERRRACDFLAPIYAWFTEGFDTPDLQDAKALLDELA